VPYGRATPCFPISNGTANAWPAWPRRWPGGPWKQARPDTQSLWPCPSRRGCCKSYTVQFGGSHAQIGASWVVDSTGNHKVAQAVYHHVEWPWPLPEDLVHPVFFVIYADKRARHDEMVSLDERYEDLLVRYGKSEHSRAAIHRGWEHSKTIERVLSAQLEFPLHESTVVGGRLVSRA